MIENILYGFSLLSFAYVLSILFKSKMFNKLKTSITLDMATEVLVNEVSKESRKPTFSGVFIILQLIWIIWGCFGSNLKPLFILMVFCNNIIPILQLLLQKEIRKLDLLIPTIIVGLCSLIIFIVHFLL